jgi:low affinity Fe/Cu permease
MGTIVATDGWPSMTSVRTSLTRLGVLASRPAAFLIVVIYAVAWAIFEPYTLDWHAYATLATWVMTLFIQRAGHRDTQAIHAKLDELLRHDPNARTEMEHEDKEEP